MHQLSLSNVGCTYTRKRTTMASPILLSGRATALTPASLSSALRLVPFSSCAFSLSLSSPTSSRTSFPSSSLFSCPTPSLCRVSEARPRPSRPLLLSRGRTSRAPADNPVSACVASRQNGGNTERGGRSGSPGRSDSQLPSPTTVQCFGPEEAPSWSGVFPGSSATWRHTARGICSRVRTPQRRSVGHLSGRLLHASRRTHHSLPRTSLSCVSGPPGSLLSPFPANFPLDLCDASSLRETSLHVSPFLDRWRLSLSKQQLTPGPTCICSDSVRRSSRLPFLLPSSSFAVYHTRNEHREGENLPVQDACGVRTPRSVASAPFKGSSLLVSFTQTRRIFMAAQEVKRDAETEEKEKAEEQRRRQHREGREAPGRTAKGDGECGARGNVERGSDESETARGDAEANDQQAADERATDDSDDEPKVYRQPEGMIQYVFQWGIGNAFRAISANRFRPVHAARPKEVSIHPSYFESPHPCLIWEPLNEAWEVYFYENLKKSAKPFPVKKFGIARAKREALAFLKQMEEEGRMEKPTFSSGVEGVTFDQVTGSWICRYVDEDGRCMSRGFGADFHGFEEAKKLAIERQEAMKNLEADCLGRNMRLAKEK